jgi:hypothetical protein
MNMNFLTPRAQSLPAGVKGRGVFAVDPIAAGDTVAGFGGYMVSKDEFEALPALRVMHSIQMTDDLYLVGPHETEDADLVNHSCEPNCGLLGATILIAMRDIEPGEEITFDYATCDGSAYDEFECACGTAFCRGKITGRDWLLPDLQRRYRGWFSPYLTRRIASHTVMGPSRRIFSEV